MGRKEPSVKETPEVAATPEAQEQAGLQAEEAAAATAQGPAAPETADQTAALQDRLVRLQADFENFRKRMLREKSEIYQTANQELMNELLPVLDHLDLALSHVEVQGENDGFVEGVRLVADQLISVLGRFGLSRVDAEGQAFDPNLHEAISHLPSPDVNENGVIQQVRPGYQLAGRLLRPAQVVVSSGPRDIEEATVPGDDAGPKE